LTVDTPDEVTNITGTLSGVVNDTINGFIANPSFSNPVSLPGDAFIYDNVFYPGQASLVDQFGVVFTTAGNPGGYWNLWSDATPERRARRLFARRVEPRRRLSDHHQRRKPGSDGGSGAFDLGDDAGWPGGLGFSGLPPESEGPSRAGVHIVFSASIP
jgi:hypothetical protein